MKINKNKSTELCWAILINTLHHFTVGAIIKIDLLVALKFFTSHLLSNYKYFSEMYILVIIIAFLLHALSVWRACARWRSFNEVCDV